MKDKVLDNLRELDILIKKRMFLIGKECGIKVPPSPLQVRIFLYIFESKEKEVSQADLVRELKVSKVSISEAISKMVNNGVVEVITNKNDARKNNITYTDKGIDVINNMLQEFEILKSELVKDISDTELENFIKVMQHMKKNIREDEYV